MLRVGGIIDTSEDPTDTVDGKNPSNHLGCIKPCKWDKLPTSTGAGHRSESESHFPRVSRTGSRCGMTLAANFSRFFDKFWWYPNKSMDVIADFPYDLGWFLELWSLLRLVCWLVWWFSCCPNLPTSSFHNSGSDFGISDVRDIGNSGHVKLQRKLRCGS